MDSIVLIGLMAGALTTSSCVPQATRIIKTRSAKDVSALFFALMAAGMCLWLVYGLARADVAIVLWNAISLAFCVLILALKKVYG
ncbi:MAG TPA: SemiSWEET transporter [Methanocella sp.]|uniref:SemiSWEET family sugar transporter n=1 Tax=Methanocella sp. TaxID=2052833 RepID=UPI002CB00B36|nr:SemiSWEET transporter [Methanocella sp.]HTY91405.1 SemiSWEET transporter [Methanocella sp.]